MRIIEIDSNFWKLIEASTQQQIPSTYVSKTGKHKPIPNPLPPQLFNQLLAKTKQDKIRRMATIQQAQKLNAARTKASELDVVRSTNLNAFV